VIELSSEKTGRAAVIRIVGRIDADTAQQLEDLCNEWIAKGEKILILDFTGVRYISSWGLRSILVVGKSLNAIDGKLIPCGLSALVKDVFQVSGFDSLFRTYPNLAAALASI
jgi:anti-anti-sigma factor